MTLHHKTHSAGSNKAATLSRRFVNRDVSWIAYNRRVVEEAENPGHPILERLRFLSIAANNLDEFEMVHVAGLLRQIAAGMTQKQADGFAPAETLGELEAAIALMRHAMQDLWTGLRRALREQGLSVVYPVELSPDDLAGLHELFEREIFPLLTPMAISAVQPFPFIPNRGLAVAARLSGPSGTLDGIVRIPQQLPRFVRLPTASTRLIAVEDLLQLHLNDLFPNHALIGSGILRVIRDSELPVEDLEMDEDAEHLLLSFETALQRSQHGDIVRLTVDAAMPAELVQLLTASLGVANDALRADAGLIGLANLAELAREDRPDLKFPPYTARYPERIRQFGDDCFAAIRAKEFLVHHPYESFDVVVQFIRQAALDPAVVAIKQTLYRTSRDSPIVQALVEAAKAGKSVTAVVELKARFDEEANLKWARDLERAGAQVTYGYIDLKIHAKLSLVIRREADGLASYIHYGTGNYHPLTARVYADLSLFSCDAGLCADAARLFNYMTGSAAPEAFERIAAAPLTLRTTLLDLIGAEAAHAKAGKPAAIWFKVNGLADPAIIEALYEASSAGVEIRGVVRGICALRARVPGLSENIRIRSLVGRYLEHARIACFGNGYGLPSAEAKLFIASADWMPRNMDRRIETLIPLETQSIRRQVMEQIMVANLNDDTQAWELADDDSWRRVKPGRRPFSAQEYFMSHPSHSGQGTPQEDATLPAPLALHRP